MSDHSRGVPTVTPISWSKIDDIVSDLHSNEFPDVLRVPQPVPVRTLFDKVLEARYQIATGALDWIGPGVEGIAYPCARYGSSEIVLREDVYDKMLEGHPRSRFTCAHECGHGVLGHINQLGKKLADGKELALYRRTSIPAYMNPESQASYFAGAFLMPLVAVRAIVKECGADPYALAKTFLVSPSAAEVRLRQLGRRNLLSNI